MTKPEVLVTRKINSEGLRMLSEVAEVTVWPDDLPPGRDQLLELVQGKAGLLTMLSDKIDAQVIAQAGPQLKVIANYAVGFDNIDLTEANKRGIAVGNTPGVLTDATADLAFALMMAAGRRLLEAERYVHAGKWKTWMPTTLLGADFVNATLGIVGFGRIGQAMAKRAKGFSMRTIFYGPTAEEPTDGSAQKMDNLDDLVIESDFISFHVPLNEQTLHMVNASFLAQMKPNAILINTSRGAVIDQEALYWALKERKIAAAALDVTDPEPLPLDSPLLTLDNCLITPHIGSASIQAREKSALMAAQNLIAGLSGAPLPYCVNPGVK